MPHAVRHPVFIQPFASKEYDAITHNALFAVVRPGSAATSGRHPKKPTAPDPAPSDGGIDAISCSLREDSNRNERGTVTEPVFASKDAPDGLVRRSPAPV